MSLNFCWTMVRNNDIMVMNGAGVLGREESPHFFKDLGRKVIVVVIEGKSSHSARC